MAVIMCVECGARANDEWERCPECGADPKRGFTEEQRKAASQAALLDPVAYARRARESGHPFLEISLPVAAEHQDTLQRGRHTERALEAAAGRAEQLAAVEEEGWELIGSSYVLNDLTYEETPNFKGFEQGWLEGKLVGIYLFRAASPPAGS